MLKKIFYLLILSSLIKLSFATDYYQQFVKALALKDEAIIEKIIPAGLNTANTSNETILMYTIANDYTEIANNLLDLGASTNIKTVTGKTALMIAVLKNNKKIINKLLEKNADLNIQDNNGYSALMYAIKAKNLEIIKIFLENSCNLNLKDKNGLSAFELAAVNLNKKELSVFYDYSTENKKYLNSALLQAVLNNNSEAVEFLLTKDVNIFLKNSKDKTILEASVESNNPKIVKLFYSKVATNASANYLEKFLVKSIQLYNQDENLFKDFAKNHHIEYNKIYKHTPYYISNIIQEIQNNSNLKNKCLEIVSLNIDEISASFVSYNCTLLDIALLNNTAVDLVKLLVQEGISLNRENKELNGTPLALAIRYSNQKVIDYLLEEHNVNFGNSNEIVNNIKKIYFCKAFYDKKTVEKSSDKKFLAFMTKFEKNGPLNLEINEFYKTADSFAVSIDEKAVFNDALMFYAFYAGNLDMLIALHNKGVDLNKPDFLGQTGLIYAALATERPYVSRFEPPQTINYLFENNYLQYKPLFSGLTATNLSTLMIVALHNDPEITKLLIQKGVDINFKSPHGLTALKCAEMAYKTLNFSLKNLKKNDLIGFFNLTKSLENNKKTQEILKKAI